MYRLYNSKPSLYTWNKPNLVIMFVFFYSVDFNLLISCLWFLHLHPWVKYICNFHFCNVFICFRYQGYAGFPNWDTSWFFLLIKRVNQVGINGLFLKIWVETCLANHLSLLVSLGEDSISYNYRIIQTFNPPPIFVSSIFLETCLFLLSFKK